jgi:hypothetical protein
MKNFKTELDRYFASCILDSLIYRSDDQTTSLVVQLFQRSLADLTRLHSSPLGQINNWLERLQGPTDPHIRLVAAVGRQDFTHKSAHLVSRMMKRQLAIRPQWIAKPWELADHTAAGAKILVFIDDFLGSGQQFADLIGVEDLRWIFSAAQVIYAPFVAHKNGITMLEGTYPGLRITAAEMLDSRHNLLHKDARSFDDGENTVEGARAYYSDMLKRNGIRVNTNDECGYGGLGLAYVFEHAVPDNNLPLLWHPGNQDWVTLFDR